MSLVLEIQHCHVHCDELLMFIVNYLCLCNLSSPQRHFLREVWGGN